MKKYTAKKGERFYRLVHTGNTERINKRTLYEFRCDCGNVVLKHLRDLKYGRVKSCGCYLSEASSKRMSKGRGEHRSNGVYRCWSGMIQRCTNKKNPRYENYGGRGIRVCKEWLDYDNFFNDMGFKPSKKHSIGRIDNDGNYERSNCRWELPQEQANNTRRNTFVDFEGQTLTISEVARKVGIEPDLLFSRLSQGMSLERAAKKENYKLIVSVKLDGSEMPVSHAMKRLGIASSTMQKRLKEGYSHQQIINHYAGINVIHGVFPHSSK